MFFVVLSQCLCYLLLSVDVMDVYLLLLKDCKHIYATVPLKYKQTNMKVIMLTCKM